MPYTGRSDKSAPKRFVRALDVRARVAEVLRNWIYQGFYLIICGGVGIILASAWLASH